MIKKILIVIFISGLCTILLSGKIQTEQDILKSFEKTSLEEKSIWEDFQRSGLYTNQVYLRYKTLPEKHLEQLHERMRDAGYHKKEQNLNFTDRTQLLNRMIFHLPQELITDHFKNLNEEKIAENYINSLTLPGSDLFIKQLVNDPSGSGKLVTDYLIDKIFGQFRSEFVTEIWSRETPLNYEKLRDLVTYLKSYKKQISYTGGDFYSYDNYSAIQEDINFCILISFILNFILIYVLCRRVDLIFWLALGTWVSYLSGLALISLFYTKVYTIVFAFTSTFVGFNNEYLIHLSGLSGQDFKKSLTGLGSAIGTTLIGFFVLLFGESEIIRQMAVISIGGMVGFLCFMAIFQKELSLIRFRYPPFPRYFLSKKKISLIMGMTLLSMCLLPFIEITTKVRDFNYISDELDIANDQFVKSGRQGLSLSNLYALKLNEGDNHEALMDKIKKHVSLSMITTPLFYYKNQNKQMETKKIFEEELQNWLPKMNSALRKRGIHQIFRPDSYKLMNEEEFLDIWTSLSFFPWIIKGEKLWAVFALDNGYKISDPDILALSPETFYNNILTKIGKNMFLMLCLGLVIMFIYLIPWQLNLSKIIYIFLPLMISVALIGLGMYFYDISLNIIHIMGFSLVIALALDYSSITISSEYSDQERGKVFLTGISALISFGVLVFAKHPVLNDLGIIVSTGIIVSLLFSQLIGLKNV